MNNNNNSGKIYKRKIFNRIQGHFITMVKTRIRKDCKKFNKKTSKQKVSTV